MLWALHGNLGQSSDWDILTSHPLGQRGAGGQGQPIRKVNLWRYLSCRSISMEEFGEIFASEVAAQDPAPQLIAYSMGARLALHALLAAPSLWTSATLISVHPGLQTDEERRLRRIRDAEWSALALQKDWSSFLTAWNAQPVLGAVPDTLADRHLLQPYAHEIARAFCAWSLGTQADLRTAVASVPTPVTLITGERDHKFTQLATELTFPNSQHLIIPDTGHRPLWEAPSAVAAAL